MYFSGLKILLFQNFALAELKILRLAPSLKNFSTCLQQQDKEDLFLGLRDQIFKETIYAPVKDDFQAYLRIFIFSGGGESAVKNTLSFFFSLRILDQFFSNLF